MIHDIPLEEATLHGYFSSVLPPVLVVDPGDSVRFQALNAGWRWDPDSEYVERDTELHNGHALTGPIELRDARAGQTLVVSIDEVTPRGWGVTFGDGTPFGWTIDGDTATSKIVCFNPMGVPMPDGTTQMMFLGLWYLDKHVRTPKGWRIAERVEQECYQYNVPEHIKVMG